MQTNIKKKQNGGVKRKKTGKEVNLLRYQNMPCSTLVTSDGYQKPVPRGKTAKFVDVLYSSNATSVGTILAGMCPITQGVGVNQRTGDTVYWRSIHINYDINTQNADVFNTSRIIIFQWHPNSNLAAPTVTDVLQTAALRSMYDWQFSNQYTILYDRVHFQSGLTTAPCDSGNQGYFGPIMPSKGMVTKAQFSPGAALGSEQYFILLISDSLIAPFPLFTATTRVIYDDE
jgi:hypothetical protein